MTHDVFISYSTKDKLYADEVCVGLEASGLTCWIAPRDILPGKDWGEAIIDGIGECRAMVVVFSISANESSQVKREVQRAFEKGVTVIPLRIDEVVPAKSMAYYLNAVHWLDAAPPLAAHIQKLVAIVRQLTAEPSTPTANRERVIPLITATETRPAYPAAARANASTSRKRWIWPVVGGMALLAGATIILCSLGRPRRAATSGIAATMPAASETPTAPSTPTALKADPALLKINEGIRDIFGDLHKMDTQLSLIDRTFSANMSDSAAHVIVDLGGSEHDFSSRWLVARNEAELLTGIGAKLSEIQAMADNLDPVRLAVKELASVHRRHVIRSERASTAIKLKFFPENAVDPMFTANETGARVALQTVHVSCSTAYLSALRVLRSMRSHLPPDAISQLASLKNLQPGELVDETQLAGLEERGAADQKRLADDQAAAQRQYEQARNEQVDQWSAALCSPFKLSELSLDRLGPLCEPMEISLTRSQADAVAQIQEAKIRQYTGQLMALFAAYAVVYAKSDPSAEDYGRAGLQFYLQTYRLGCTGGLYLCKLMDGWAKEGGLHEGDILVDYGGKAVASLAELGAAMKVMPASEPVRIEFLRRDDHGRFQRQPATLPHGGALGATFLPI